MAFYIFTVNPSIGETLEDSRAILSERFRNGLWRLNRLTFHQKELKDGDQIIFYVAGPDDPHKYHFLGTGEVAGPRRRATSIGGEILLATNVSDNAGFWALPVQNLKWFKRPVPTKPLVPSLSFIRKKDCWGTYFQGGIRRIPEIDFNLIRHAASHPDRSTKC